MKKIKNYEMEKYLIVFTIVIGFLFGILTMYLITILKTWN